jgi:hypothetical protein
MVVQSGLWGPRQGCEHCQRRRLQPSDHNMKSINRRVAGLLQVAMSQGGCWCRYLPEALRTLLTRHLFSVFRVTVTTHLPFLDIQCLRFC